MKTSKALFAIAFLLTIFSCQKNDSTGGWSEADETFHNQVLSLQEEAYQSYESWLDSYDSLEAVSMLQQYFLADSLVSEATAGPQGIAVRYTNGIIGGIFLNPGDSPEYSGNFEKQATTPGIQETGLKSVVNNRKSIFLNPSYWERSEFADQIKQLTFEQNLPKVGFGSLSFYTNSGADIDQFCDLKGFGYIHIYTHGWAYPTETFIEDVYIMTGEEVNKETSEKYWEDLKEGRIAVVQTKQGNQSKKLYFITKDLITKYNDFSKDTVLLYGGFCYSFLGKWPEIHQSFGKGTYFGFTWAVRTFNNSNWSVNLMYHLSDTSNAQPMTTEAWMSHPELPKSYYSEELQKTISIQYAGDGALRLWGKGGSAQDSLPTVTTQAVSSVTSNTAACGGNVTAQGASPVTVRGVCWGTEPNPTINGDKTVDGSGTGAFTSELTGLQSSTPYYVRAYATNAHGTAYGTGISFTTTGPQAQPCPGLPVLTDERDGKNYPTVQIGDQCWLQKNLNYEMEGTRCFDNDPLNCEKYGRFYNWEMAMTACPSGWHLPSEAEFDQLADYLGGYLVAGGKMKVAGTEYWELPNTDATNESGFSALGTGWHEGSNGYNLNQLTHFWTSTLSTPGSTTHAQIKSLQAWDPYFSGNAGHFVHYLYSVRCLRD